MTNDDSRKWIRKGSRSDFVTDYAMTSPDEDIAETGAAYMHNTLKLWKVAIAQSSSVLMGKAKAIEQNLWIHDGKHRYFSDTKTFDVPTQQAPGFFDRACGLLDEGKPLARVEQVLCEEYAAFVSEKNMPLGGSTLKGVSQRLRSILIFGILMCGTLVALLVFGSAAAVKGVYTYDFGAYLLLLIILNFLQNHGFALASQYLEVEFFRMSGLGIGLLILIILSCLGGGWLLTHGYRMIFRLVTTLPAIAVATMTGKWLLSAPDSKDELGRLKFSTRSALIGLYLALISFSFTMSAMIVDARFPK